MSSKLRRERIESGSKWVKWARKGSISGGGNTASRTSIASFHTSLTTGAYRDPRVHGSGRYSVFMPKKKKK
nr:hypothetical protein CFP56_32241 [Quercus suber]